MRSRHANRRKASSLSSKARRLEIVSIAETLSFIALLWAMFTHNEGAVSIIGAIHGLLFLAYAIFVWVDHDDLGWTPLFSIICIVTGPLGAIIVMERLRRDRRGALE